MVNRVKFWLLTAAVCAVGVFLLWTCVQPLFAEVMFPMFHVYCRVFLLLFAINTFAVLRLYNSVLQNTRFIIKIRQTIGKTNIHLPRLETAMRQLASAVNFLKSSIERKK